MKKLKLKALTLNVKDILSREKMKHVLGASSNRTFGTWCGDECGEGSICYSPCPCTQDPHGVWRCGG